jgi:predicted MPP superfamily phosphohydrolase
MFFIIVIALFAIGNTYIYIRSYQALELFGSRFRLYYSIVFWVVALLFIFTHIVRLPGSGWVDALNTIGSYWIAVMLYAFLLLLLIDIFRIIGWIGAIKPAFIYANYPLSKLVLFGISAFILTIILTIGYRNARYPQVTRLEIPVTKQAGNLKELKIAMVSDVHLGHTAGNRFLGRVVDRINDLEPDVVLLAGDVFDGSPEPVIRKNMGAEFERLKSTYGTFAISGNHEYIGEREMKGGSKKAFDYLTSHHVTVLLDSVVLVDSSFYIAGRKDYSRRPRQSLKELLGATSNDLPVIALDHQPYHLDEAEQAGVDLQLSGHTHHGQLWPISWITKRIYEKDWGYLQKGNAHFYVSCGVGTWGPAVRTAGHSEIVFIRMTFE